MASLFIFIEKSSKTPQQRRIRIGIEFAAPNMHIAVLQSRRRRAPRILGRAAHSRLPVFSVALCWRPDATGFGNAR
ncbi:MAG: hypothetical protein WAR81_10940 [Pseudomonadales bacterium]